MAKAFTEKERELIRERLQQEGLKQIKEKGLKKVSVQQLTQAVGIAQGGFYSFYESKEELFLECVNKRIAEKIAVFVQAPIEAYADQIEDPVRFMADRFYAVGMHLKDNLAFNNLISDSVNILLADNKNLEQNSIQSIKKLMLYLTDFWKSHGLIVEVDSVGLRAFLKAAAVLFMNEEIIGKQYFSEIYRVFIDENTKRYIKVTGTYRP